MTNENQPLDQGAEVASEDAPDVTPPAQPTLNRAERRAQAKGKKGATAGGNSSLHHSGSSPGSFNRGSGGVGKTRLPRTGHK